MKNLGVIGLCRIKKNKIWLNILNKISMEMRTIIIEYI